MADQKIAGQTHPVNVEHQTDSTVRRTVITCGDDVELQLDTDQQLMWLPGEYEGRLPLDQLGNVIACLLRAQQELSAETNTPNDQT